MTIPLATLHPKTLDFDAAVKEVTAEGLVELDRTYFYATGGGQPHDTGTISAGGDTYQVLEVLKRDGTILHRLDRPGLSPGTQVRGSIDTGRRERLRRVHTATHVLCAVLERHEGTRITGNQLGPDKTRVDFDMEDYDQGRLQQYITQANEIIAQALPVRRSVITREELLRKPELIKLAAGFPEHIREVHLVEIGDVDAQPCGGTHCDSTAEIGRIVFLKAENRGKSSRRVYFTVEP